MFNSPIHPLKTGIAFTNAVASTYWAPDTGLINCWCCPPGTSKVEVWLIGGGGGGGGGGVQFGANTWGGGGAGGGGGGISSCIFYGNQIPASAAVCLGAGGAGGAGSITVPFTCATNGANGGMTSFGSIVHAGGGGGGQRGRSGVCNQVAESTGGAGGTGNFSPRGGSGGNGYFFPTVPNPGNEAFPGLYQGGGGAGGGAGTFGGVTDFQAGALSDPAGLLPLPVSNFGPGTCGIGILNVCTGAGGAQCTGFINGQNAINCVPNYGGGGGGGGGARSGGGTTAGSGGLGAPGVALVISYF